MTNKSRRKRQQRRLERERAERDTRVPEEIIETGQDKVHQGEHLNKSVKKRIQALDEEYQAGQLHANAKVIRSPKAGPKSIGVTLNPAFQRRLLTFCIDTERTQAAACRYLMSQALNEEGY